MLLLWRHFECVSLQQKILSMSLGRDVAVMDERLQWQSHYDSL